MSEGANEWSGSPKEYDTVKNEQPSRHPNSKKSQSLTFKENSKKSLCGCIVVSDFTHLSTATVQEQIHHALARDR